ncbi:uridine diphosphate-N-acetylglucosamine-binding protein YvcK [Corynebacterium sp. L4756]|uniref:gluconeogenesis factor YvcK family protein n=1 Tax=unclassified Corynebacterium TaxID=2624378 RepID=UPI00374DA8B7
MSTSSFNFACLGGGHGLFQTLLAARKCDPDSISAIVTVADDGGSSGRLRRELDIIPPGDLRMALAALSRNDANGELWAQTLQHRFRGTGALAGHAVGNLLIAGLAEVLGDMQAALDKVAELTDSHGRVLPVVNRPLSIEAEVAGLEDDPRVIRAVRGQVAVATTPGEVRRVHISPSGPQANPRALQAINDADVITIGPGSWFSSVLPHMLVPQIVDSISRSNALRVLVLNLSVEPGETNGFSVERHLHVLAQHAPKLQVDRVLIDSNMPLAGSERTHVQRTAAQLGAEVVFADVCMITDDGLELNRHDPTKLATVLSSMRSDWLASQLDSDGF